MKASVILPVYNGACFLKQSVESILNQDFKDFEFIIIDDGSKDNSWKIIKNYAKHDKRIKAIRHSKNQGLVNTLNECLKIAKSDLIIRMDQDDESLPCRIRTQCDFMDKNPNITVAGSFVYHMGITPKNDRLIILPTDTKEIKNKLLNTENCIYHPSVIMRKKDILSLGGYHKHFKNCEDYDLWIRVVQKFSISNIDIPLLRYRITTNGMTFNKKWEQLFYMFLALQTHKNPKMNYDQIKQLAEKDLMTFNKRNFLSNHYLYSIEELLLLKKYSEVFGLIRKTFKEIGIFKSSTISLRIIKKIINNSLGTKQNLNTELNSKNVLFALPYIVLGGADKRFKIIANLLKNNGYSVSIITTVPPTNGLIDVTSEFEHITKDIFNLPKLLINTYDWKNFIIYFIQSRKIGTIFLGGSQFFYELLPELKRIFPNIKIVDQQFNTGCHFLSNRKFSKFIDYTIAENEEIVDKLKNKYFEDPKKVFLIHNGVDINEFSRNNNQIKKRPDYIPKNKIIITFLGRLSEEKGPDIFIKIANYFKNNNNVYFILAGDGPEKQTCEKLISEFDIKNIIFMPGIVDSKQCLKYSDVLLITSRLDGRPNAILESMAMGVPVISFKVGGIPNMVKNGQNGYLCQDNQEIVDKINMILNNNDKLSELKTNAKIHAKKFFDESKNITKYLKIIK